eukprot:SAG22_NODE_7288_length_754_cov_3.328244_1_plen_142_part_10
MNKTWCVLRCAGRQWQQQAQRAACRDCNGEKTTRGRQRAVLPGGQKPWLAQRMASKGGLTVKSAEVKNADMEEEVAQDLIQLCIDTMTKVPKEALMAPIIKREMDKRYSPTWHVFIGKVSPPPAPPPPPRTAPAPAPAPAPA